MKRAVIFLSFGQFGWNCIFECPRSRAFQRRMACRIPAKKNGSSHLFGVVPSRSVQTAFVPELSKAITFLSYVLSWWNCTFELGSSRAFQQCFALGAAPQKSCTYIYIYVPFKSFYFSVLHPILLKLNMSAHLIQSFPTAFSLCSCFEIKLSVPLEAHALKLSMERGSSAVIF